VASFWLVRAGCSHSCERVRLAERDFGDKGANQRVCLHPVDPETFPTEQLGGYMKTIKSLVLGSAATLVAMGGAQAADLSVKAKAVEYVKICSLSGAGLYYIPGTDTCVKIGGYLRTDVTVNGQAGGAPFWSGGGAYGERYVNEYNDYSRMAL